MFEKRSFIPGPGTIVGINVRLTGTLKDIDDIIIRGKVEGEIISEKNVLIADSAVVRGPITAQVVTIAGKVRGTIAASQKLEILPPGKVFGGITTRDLIIRSGAIFVGKSNMPTEEEKEKTPEEKEEEKEKPYVIEK